jgi:hypothetical protein
MPYSGVDLYPPHLGSQSPRTGNRFAGVFTYGDNVGSPGYREYIQVPLQESLVVGELLLR